MSVRAVDAAQPWTDYVVRNHLSGKTYRVALRGLEPGDSYCSCPDFRTNTLGTCKHVLRVLANGEAPLHAPGSSAGPFVRRAWRSTCVMPTR